MSRTPKADAIISGLMQIMTDTILKPPKIPDDCSEMMNKIISKNIPADVYETDTHLFIIAEVPGVSKEHLNIMFNSNHTLVISYERPDIEVNIPGTLGTVHTGRKTGKFEVTINLPANVNAKEVKTVLDNGILNLQFTKVTKDKEIIVIS